MVATLWWKEDVWFWWEAWKELMCWNQADEDMFPSHTASLSWTLSFPKADAFAQILAYWGLQMKNLLVAAGCMWPLGVACRAAVILSFIHKFSKRLLRAHKMLAPGHLERNIKSLLFQGDLGVILWGTHSFPLGSCFLLVHLLGTLSAKMRPSPIFMFCCDRVAGLRPPFLPRITITDGLETPKKQTTK